MKPPPKPKETPYKARTFIIDLEEVQIPMNDIQARMFHQILTEYADGKIGARQLRTAARTLAMEIAGALPITH